MAGTVTSTRIQIKKNDNALLFPRVRTVDMRDSANEENIFDADDKLSINYLPIVQSTDVEATGDQTKIPTESCMVDYVTDMVGRINSDIAILTSNAGVVSVKGANGLTPTTAQTGAVTLSGVNTTGDGATVGVVATKEQALTTAAAYGLAAVEGNGGSKIVPTWNTFVNAIKAVSDAANTVDHTHATTDTNGVHLIQNGTAWTAGANSATDAAIGTVQFATSVNVIDSAFNTWKAVDVKLLRRYLGPIRVTGVKSGVDEGELPNNTEAWLIQQGDSAGLYFNDGGHPQWGVAGGINDEVVYDNKGVVYVKNTGEGYTGTRPSGEDAYIPLVNRTSKGGLTITSRGTIYLTSNGDGTGTNLTPVTTLSTVVGATATQKADVNMVPTVGAAAEISALAQSALDAAGTASTNAGGKLARVYGSHGTSTADNSTVVGTDVKNLYHLHTGDTDAAVKNATFGVVQTIPSLKTNENVSDGNGLDVISALAVGTGKVYADGAAWETALQNNIVPTVAAIQGACLFYTEFAD